VITSSMDTTVAPSSHAYDRIIINEAAQNNFVAVVSWMRLLPVRVIIILSMACSNPLYNKVFFSKKRENGLFCYEMSSSIMMLAAFRLTTFDAMMQDFFSLYPSLTAMISFRLVL